eukprot:5407198-Prymnesium_polylepis.1
MRSAQAHDAICLDPPHDIPPHRPCCCNPSRSVAQMRAAEFRGAHVGAGGGGDARRAGRWVQAQSDARTGDATAWCA